MSGKSRSTQTAIASFISSFTIVLCAQLLKMLDLTTEWRIVLALVPAIPTAMLVWFMAKAIMEMDELQRKIQIEGLAFAFAGTAFVTLFYGMLQLARVGLPHISTLFIYVLMVLLYGIGTVLAGRKYR